MLISQSEQQSLFTLNQKDAETRIALHFSERRNSVSVKDTDKLILMVYTFAVFSPPYDWYLQIDNVKKFQNLGKTKDADLPMLT